jgi:hypothetical protein
MAVLTHERHTELPQADTGSSLLPTFILGKSGLSRAEEGRDLPDTITRVQSMIVGIAVHLGMTWRINPQKRLTENTQ